MDVPAAHLSLEGQDLTAAPVTAMSASTPERNSPPKLPSFLSPSKQTLRVYDGKNWIPKPWSHDFEKYTLERLIHFQRKGAGLPEKVQANLVAINENVKSINSLNEELASLRKEHLSRYPRQV